MKLSLRHKIIGANLIVLLLTFIVISVTVLEGFNTMNRGMLVQNLIHQSEISVISIKQSLLTGEDISDRESEFNVRSRDFALKLSRESGLRVLIFSKSLDLIADSENTKQTLPEFKELDEVLNGNRAYVIRRLEGIRYLYFAFPVMQGGNLIGEVMLVYPMQEIDKNSRNIRVLLLISFVIGTLVILAASIALSLKITGPILKLKEYARKISEGHFRNRIDIKSSDEVGELAAAFNTMQREIENRIDIINIEKGKLDSILESMGEGVIALNGRNEIIAINSSARAIMDSGVEAETARIAKKVRGQKSRSVVEVNSGEKSLLVCATPLPLEEGRGVVLVLNDVTELRLLQEKQRQFVTNVSHELKTPLTTIMGYVDLLKQKGNNRDVFDTSVHYLKSASDRLLRLVNDLIDLSALSKFEFEIEPKSTDISGLIRDIVGQMSLKAQKFNIKIHMDIPEVLEILIDPVRIKQAVVNILDNAIKYSPEGDIFISLSQNEEIVRLEVMDSGYGIPPEMLDKIFEPFYRVDKARSRSLGGNGLGLAISKEIVEKHGGRIEIKSREGEGTTVSIYLPR